MLSRIQKIIISWASALLSLVIFAIPIEHKYDKPLRRLSEKIIPQGLSLPQYFDKKIYFYPSDIAALFLFFIALFIFRRYRQHLLLKKETFPLWIIFFSAILSLVTSPLSEYPLVYTRLLQLFTPFALFAWITQIPSSEKRTKTLLNAFVITALIQSCIAITQYFKQGSLGLRLLGEPSHATASFFIPEGKRWIFDHLFSYTADPNLWRVSGTLPHCNVFGGFMFISILISYALIIGAKNTKTRLLLAASLVIQVFALSISYSRSALFATILGTLVWFSWAFFKQGIRTLLKTPSYRFLILTIAIAVLINIGLLGEQFLYRGGILNYNNLVVGSDAIRTSLQNVAFKIIQDHPVTGVGFHQFSLGATPYLAPNEYPAAAHNIYLFLASEMGILALTAFLGFIGIIGNEIRKTSFSPQTASLIALFIGFLFIGGCDFYPIFYQQGKLMFFILAALLFVETQKYHLETHYATPVPR